MLSTAQPWTLDTHTQGLLLMACLDIPWKMPHPSLYLCQNQAEAPLLGIQEEKVPGVVTSLFHTRFP